jgi:hypothetical protein
MLDRSKRAPAVNTPDLAQDGLEADAMLIDGLLTNGKF